MPGGAVTGKGSDERVVRIGQLRAADKFPEKPLEPKGQPAKLRRPRGRKGPPRQGKSDPLNAVSAARAAQSGRAAGASKGRDGAVEAIRALMVAKRSAAGERTQTINQARALVPTGPDDLRACRPSPGHCKTC